jgi:hypothetical protein
LRRGGRRTENDCRLEIILTGDGERCKGGVGDQKEMGNIYLYDRRLAPQLDVGKVNGNPVRGAMLSIIWFENGKLHRDPGNGKPTQTLKRVG